MSSNFFLSGVGSESGQLDSSWWQKMTFSRMAFETPNCIGTSSSSAAHLVDRDPRTCVPRISSGDATRARSREGAHVLLLAVLVDKGQGTLERLHRQPGYGSLLLGDLQPTVDEHLLLLRVEEAQLDLGLDLGRASDLRARYQLPALHPSLVRAHRGVVNERSSLGVGREVSSRGVLEALDDGLPSSSRQLPRFLLSHTPSELTVLPLPLCPTMTVRGVKNCMTESSWWSKDRLREERCGQLRVALVGLVALLVITFPLLLACRLKTWSRAEWVSCQSELKEELVLVSVKSDGVDSSAGLGRIELVVVVRSWSSSSS